MCGSSVSWVGLAGLTLCLLCCTGCRGQAQPPPPPPNPATYPGPLPRVDARVLAANSQFAFKLFGQLRQGRAADNLFISPTSVALALAMTYNGAAGDTREAMARALGLQGLDLATVNRAAHDLMAWLQVSDPEIKLKIANALWCQRDVRFRRDFLRVSRDSYEAEVQNLDFASSDAAATINAWVKDKTEGKIPEIIAGADLQNAAMVLVNAVYFLGRWSDVFGKASTQDAPFTLADGWKKTVRMMGRSGQYPYLQGDGFQAITMPYGKRRLGMTIILPAKGLSLEEFCARLTPERWDEWMQAMLKQQGTIRLPRFRLEYEVKLNEALKALGMEVAFDRDRADFSGMCQETRLWIGSVKHKTYVDVNEEGTEAAAATSVAMLASMPPPPPPIAPFEMVVDRPFLCAIRDDRTGTLLFLGAIMDPKAGPE
jgi:serine protease inhibitor